jgi:hypothetical protein
MFSDAKLVFSDVELMFSDVELKFSDAEHRKQVIVACYTSICLRRNRPCRSIYEKASAVMAEAFSSLCDV